MCTPTIICTTTQLPTTACSIIGTGKKESMEIWCRAGAETVACVGIEFPVDSN